jgi:hypothetical protein
MPASNLFVSTTGRLCNWPPREAASTVLQCCARHLPRAVWTAGTVLGSAWLPGMGLADRNGRRAGVALTVAYIALLWWFG